jgi:hypothetical protein
MNQFQRVVAGIAVLVVFGFVAATLIVGAVYLVAILAPVLGLLYFGFRCSLARVLWRSHGRFQLPGAIRIIGATRTRLLAALEVVNGIGGFIATLAVPTAVLGPHSLALPALSVGLVLPMLSRSGRRRVMEGAHPVDLLPRE